MHETLAQLGEREILNRLKPFVAVGQIDDDTAQINPLGRELLINTDVLVEGIHFSTKTTSASDVGWRAISTNLSDLAASGVDQVLCITVGLVAPSNTPWQWVENAYQGMKEALELFGGELVGGDCSRGQQKLLAITAIGTLGPLRLHRSKAQPGDWLVTSGPHGLSRLGLALLSSDPKVTNKQLPLKLKTKAIKCHQRPQPPLQALKTLQKCKPRGMQWRVGGTDSSDGLLAAIENLCLCSGCQAVLYPSELPRAEQWPLGTHWDNWCMNGGEDFELVLSMPKEWANAFLKTFPSSRAIGTMKAGPPEITWNSGKRIEISKTEEFKHF